MDNKLNVGKNLKLTWAQLTEKFPRKLPHYKENETKTIKRFIELGYLPGDYSFDVRLPYQLSERELKLGEGERRMMRALKSMRIDAVVEAKDVIWVLEVCRGLELSYTGKILGYTNLYKDIFKPDKPLKMGVVGLQDDVLARRALEQMGVKIWIVKI